MEKRKISKWERKQAEQKSPILTLTCIKGRKTIKIDSTWPTCLNILEARSKPTFLRSHQPKHLNEHMWWEQHTLS